MYDSRTNWILYTQLASLFPFSTDSNGSVETVTDSMFHSVLTNTFQITKFSHFCFRFSIKL